MSVTLHIYMFLHTLCPEKKHFYEDKKHKIRSLIPVNFQSVLSKNVSTLVVGNAYI